MGAVTATSQAGRRVVLNRLYKEYRHDKAFAEVRLEASGVLVPGDGPMDPKLMFIGEAPGAQEHRQQKPFVGASGKLLNELLASVGLQREQVFITNTVKFRPRDNRDPKPAEREAGRRYLFEEWRLLGRPPVVTLGRHAAATLDVEFVHPPRWQLPGEMRVLALRHPAYAIYQQAHRPAMFEAFKMVTDAPE